MKVENLTGSLLDAWVAICLDPREWIIERKEWGLWIYDEGNHEEYGISLWGPQPREIDLAYRPSLLWIQGGPIIERDQIFLDPPHDTHHNGGPNAGWKRYDQWTATVSTRTRTWLKADDSPELVKLMGGRPGRGAGETPLIAAMRAKVVSHYGDEVPDDLPSAKYLA